MSDQAAGGGIESHMSPHRRQDSGDEPMPTEPAPEARSTPSESDSEALSPPQDLPRGSRKLSQSGPARTTRVVSPPQGLSRNPSTSSTASVTITRPHAEYLPGRSPAPEKPISTPPATPAIDPPVTKSTLSELDVHKIVHNPKLRHDINFDPDLHFRPNLDGDKGKRKQEKANQFWKALFDQLNLFVVDRDAFLARYGNGEWCLPVLLQAVRDIIETLVPLQDRALLNEGLNVDLLMQQFSRGVADLEQLASWLASILKLHCAPMRDEWVDGMYQELSNGNRNNDVTELVKGMRSLLSVLEAMKLDVANHQIRCLRPVLIEDTVHFEQRFFVRKIESRKLSIAPSRAWYREAQLFLEGLHATSPLPHLPAFGSMAVFFHAVSKLLLPSTCTKAIPPTFVFDEDRMLKLRSDLHDSICLEICMRKYDELESLSRITQSCAARIPSYVNDEAAGNRLSGDFNFMAPAASRPCSFAFSDRSSNYSSPRTSGTFLTQPAPSLADARVKASEVYSTLLDLLHTAPPTTSAAERWSGLVGAMALQVLRCANAPTSLPGFESQLAAALADVHGSVFREVEAHFQQRLLAELAKRVSEFKDLSGIALFSTATGARVHGGQQQQQQQSSRSWDRARDHHHHHHHHNSMLAEPQQQQPRDLREDAGVDDMAARLAHLGILHWRVWAPLAYEGDIESELNALHQHPAML